jgi:Undecaprenyl-phosphate glucose phosphotransferase
MKKRTQTLIILYILTDLVMLNLSLWGVFVFKYLDRFPPYFYEVALIESAIWLLIIFMNDSNQIYFREGFINRLKTQIINFGVFVGLVSMIMFTLKLSHYSRTVILGSIILFFFTKSLIYFIVYRYLGKLRLLGRHVASVLVVGAGRMGESFYHFTEENKQLGYKVVGFLDDDKVGKENWLKKLIVGKTDELEKVLNHYHVDELLIAIPIVLEEKIRNVISIADFHGIRIRLIPDFFRLLGKKYKLTRIGDIPIINVREIPLDNFHNTLIKRTFDIFCSFCVLFVGIIIFPIIALLVKINAKGPVFYKPLRISKGGKAFKCYKFRTMIENDSETNGTKSTKANDERITKIGKFLRKYNLDELPQFWNVLKGEMSVVGPRPHRLNLNYNLQQVVDGYMIRQYVKPGITGWAQVNGWRGPTETDEQKIQRTTHDLWYIENWSFWLDIRIIFLTVFSKKSKLNAF